MKSRTITTQGYYECEFNSNGVFLTEISGADATANIGGPWYYMMPGQYVEGTTYLNSTVRTETLPTNLVFNGGITTSPRKSFDFNYIEFNDIWNTKPSPPVSSHTCTDFKWYYGFIEHYEYCVTCEKKR